MTALHLIPSLYYGILAGVWPVFFASVLCHRCWPWRAFLRWSTCWAAPAFRSRRRWPPPCETWSSNTRPIKMKCSAAEESHRLCSCSAIQTRRHRNIWQVHTHTHRICYTHRQDCVRPLFKILMFFRCCRSPVEPLLCGQPQARSAPHRSARTQRESHRAVFSQHGRQRQHKPGTRGLLQRHGMPTVTSHVLNSVLMYVL